jgi:glycosyltransferase involved in cell wall biosynthesis
MGEPLGHSQVAAYLERLASEFDITLVSFEKTDADVAGLRERFVAAGVRWVPLRYHRRPPVVATAWDVHKGARAARRVAADAAPDILHVRSYVAALIALRSGLIDSAPLLLDIRGFWADERVEGGLWRSGGVLYSVAKRCERQFYASADAVVTLTQASVPQVRQWAGERRVPIEVIPTCVDPAMYARNGARPEGPHAVWSGSISTWYRFDLGMRLARALGLPLTVMTREIAAAHAELRGVPADVRTVLPEAMPGQLFEGDVGLCLIRPSFSKTASAPTRFAEYLAAGMPVAVTPGVGDLERFVEAESVGVVVRDESDAALSESAERLKALAADPTARARCRALARERFDVQAGARAYAALYRSLAGDS